MISAEVVGSERFLVVHLSAPIEVCRERDQEGLYAAADAGEIANFPGVSFKYEEPPQPDLVIPTDKQSVDACVDSIIAVLEAKGVL